MPWKEDKAYRQAWAFAAFEQWDLDSKLLKWEWCRSQNILQNKENIGKHMWYLVAKIRRRQVVRFPALISPTARRNLRHPVYASRKRRRRSLCFVKSQVHFVLVFHANGKTLGYCFIECWAIGYLPISLKYLMRHHSSTGWAIIRGEACSDISDKASKSSWSSWVDFHLRKLSWLLHHFSDAPKQSNCWISSVGWGLATL